MTPTHPLRAWRGFLPALAGAFFLAGYVLTIASGFHTAEADIGGDGGSGTGTGSCSYSNLHWEHVKSWSQVKRNDTSQCYNNIGENPGGCDNHGSDMLDIWYLATPSGQWAGKPEAGLSAASGATVRSVIDNTTVSTPNGYTQADVRAEAKSHVAASNNIVVCVWGGAFPDKIPATKPTAEAPSCTYPRGRIQIPSDGYGSRTYYETANGTDLTKGRWYVIGEDITRAFTIRQKLGTSGTVWTDGTRTPKSWSNEDFPALSRDVPACEVRVRITATPCNGTPNSGYFTLTSLSDDSVRVFANGRQIQEGVKNPANDATTVTFSAQGVRSGYSLDLTVNGSDTKSYTFKSCNSTAVSASVNFTEPAPSYNCQTQTTTWSRGTYMKSQSDDVTWTESGATDGTAGQTVTLTATAPSGKTFPTTPAGSTLSADKRKATWTHTWSKPAYTGPTGPCGQSTPEPTSETRYEYESRTLTSTYCSNGSATTTVPSTTTTEPYPFAWTTTIDGGGPHPGPTDFEGQSETTYTPLGRLFQEKAAQNAFPSQSEITDAIEATRTARHAALDLTDTNRQALAEGGVMNVREFTTYVVVSTTRTDYYDQPYQTCWNAYQDQTRSRAVTTTKTPDPTTYTVQRSQRTTRPATSTSYTWEVRTRDRQRDGDGCGSASVPAAYKGTNADGPEDNAWSEPTGNTCNNGSQNRWAWGGYTAWDSWRDNSGASRPAACDRADGRVSRETQVRNCATVPGQSAYDSGWSTPTTTDSRATACPSPATGSYQSGASTVEYRYTCTQNETTYTTTTSEGPWSEWANSGPSRQGSSETTYGTPIYSGSVYDNNYEAQSPQMTGVWQSLSNHCNAAGMANAVGSARVIDQEAANSAHLSGVVVSPIHRQAGEVTWGEAAADPEGTDDDGFFDKQCSYDGTRDGQGGSAASYTFFRDNEFRPTQVDLYRPTTAGLVTDDGSAALRTIVTRWAPGTPDPQGSLGGFLRGSTTDGQRIFANSSAAPPVFRNWSSSGTGTAATWAVLDGQQTDFYYAASWASETGRPNVYAIKWEYAPLVASRGPVNNVGFAGPGGSQSYDIGTVATKVQGQVYGAHGVATTPAMPDRVAASTGSGVTENRLDAGLIDGEALDSQGRWAQDPAAYSVYYNVVRFVRAVAQ